MKDLNMKMFLLIIILFLSYVSIVFGEYRNIAQWNSNALILVDSPSNGAKCLVTSTMTFSTKDLLSSSARINGTLGFERPKIKTSCLRSLKNKFKVKTIYFQKRDLNWLKNQYNFFKKNNVDNLDSYSLISRGLGNNDVYQCFISWIDEREPKHWVSISPCFF